MKKKRISLETDRRTIRVGRRYGALVLRRTDLSRVGR